MHYGLKVTLWGVAMVGLIQLIPITRDNPSTPKDQEIVVPEKIKALMVKSCYDCHANTTTWPWYSYIAPFSWTIADHVHDGRKALNFSVWNTYDEQKQQKLKRGIYKKVFMAMPPSSYTFAHENAILAEGEKKELQAWTGVTLEELEAHKFE